MNIFIIGFMGSGKSSFGKKLASRLSKKFIDLDQEIEQGEGKSIKDIFAEVGEEGFRKVESDYLFKQQSDLDAVVSLGGGTPCSDTNWGFIGQNGTSIYLKTRPDILLGRLRTDRDDRPLIADLSDKELKDFVADKLLARSVYYDKSDLTYDKDKTSFEFLVNQLEDYAK